MAHDTHHHNEGKKAVFGPPVIMGLAFWLFAFFFLSLCDGKKGHDAHESGAGHGAVKEVAVGDSTSMTLVDSLGNTFEVKVADTPKEPVKTDEHAH
ncbi:MAG: hypothetical protein Q8M29_14830 [Bacteroidota bacterium]|nr:hypothetical protein [Bacteroidota bacterium]